MKQGSERRLSKRRVFDQPLSFEIMGEGIEIIKKDATGINISPGGLGMTTEYALKKRDILRLYIPAEGGMPLPVFGDVVWSKPIDTHYGVGLRFLS